MISVEVWGLGASTWPIGQLNVWVIQWHFECKFIDSNGWTDMKTGGGWKLVLLYFLGRN
jgi:hypothetical protein